MAGSTTANNALLIRGEIWSNQLKEVFQDEMMYGSAHVKWLGGEFSDGDTFTIPSIGESDVFDYSEDAPIQYTSLDSGEFQFSVTEYKGVGHYITKKARQDLHYAAQLEASFVPKQAAALRRNVEQHILKQGQPGTSGGQTVANLNSINGTAHRWVGMDTRTTSAGTIRVISPEDFSRAKHSLKMANVPMSNLVAFVDPSAAAVIETHPNFINFSDNKNVEGLINTGMSTGMRWIKNIFGFDVYESNFLPYSGSGQTGLSETIDGVASGTNAKCNLFFSADQIATPWIGAWRQMPQVDAEYNKDFQREEYVTTARYGVKLYRPENLVTVLTGTAIW